MAVSASRSSSRVGFSRSIQLVPSGMAESVDASTGDGEQFGPNMRNMAPLLPEGRRLASVPGSASLGP